MELISRQALAAFMLAKSPVPGRPISYQALADTATRELHKAGLRDMAVSKGTVQHLVNGYIKSTHPDRAKAICRALDVPVGALFVTKVSIVQRDVPKAVA